MVAVDFVVINQKYVDYTNSESRDIIRSKVSA